MDPASPPEPASVQAAPRVVVVGASSGGIDALQVLLGALPADLPAAVVVAQHIDPQRSSHLAEVLAVRTPLRVRTIEDRAPLEPGVVYVAPPDRDIEVADGDVVVRVSDGGPSKPSVDRLLATAAHACNDDLIAVVLSGSGIDGAAGVQAVKAHGGIVVVQNPETAQFAGMPRAVHPSAVDIVADIDAIGPLLVDLISGAFVVQDGDDDSDLRSFLARVRERSGLDFGSYKRPTIVRRLQRRMAAAGTTTLVDYRRYIERHPDELQRLVAAFLIKVTDFFRDPDLVAYLRDEVLPGLIDEARARGELRLWSAGCATGEEAYSLAMLVADLLGDDDDLPVRIFATDVATDALDFARRGVFPAAALEGLPSDLLQRHFMPIDGSWEIRKRVRGMVIFGEHDLGNRAPFPRIDLVLCRNVLIYFTPELQRRALQLFAFSLRRGGYLALGKAEAVSPLPQYFSLEHPRLKIFRRVGDPVPIPPDRIGPSPMTAGSRRPTRLQDTRRAEPGTVSVVRDPARGGMLARLLDHVPVGIVTVERTYHIRTINTAARRLLGIRSAGIGEDLIHRATPGVASPLRGLIDRALRGDVVHGEIHVADDLLHDNGRDVQIACSPASDGESASADLVVITIEDCTERNQRIRDLEAERDRLTTRADREATRATAATAEVRDLRDANQEMASVLGAMRGENEELQVANEEAQAAAEEIETLNEELQATVEELTATNDELQSRTIELHDLAVSYASERQRLEEILQQTPSGMLVLDGPEHVVRFANGAALDWMGSPAGDVVGRGAATLFTGAKRRWRAVLDQVFASGEPWVGRETPADEPESETLFHDVVVQPLRDKDGAVLGVLVQTVDASERVDARRERERTLTSLDEERTRLDAILAAMADAVLVVDPDGNRILANAAHDRLFGGRQFAPSDEQGRLVPEEEWPDRRVARGESFVVPFSMDVAEGDRRWFEASGQPVRIDGEMRWGLVVVRDITERSLRRLQEQFIAVAGHELRTPLTVLHGSLQLAERGIGRGDDVQQRRNIERAIAQSRRLEAQVAELMDVARMQQGTFRLDRAPVDLAEVVRRGIDLARLIANGREVTLEASAESLVAFGDERRLEQVLLNLVSNAITHAPGDEAVAVSLEQRDGAAVLSVRDRGPGIPPDVLPNIFTRFYQGDDAASGRKGLGLGLCIAREIVVGHEGAIDVESTTDGTTFTVVLPLRHDRPAGTNAPNSRPAPDPSAPA